MRTIDPMALAKYLLEETEQTALCKHKTAFRGSLLYKPCDAAGYYPAWEV